MRRGEGSPMTIGRVFTTVTKPEATANGKALVQAKFTLEEAEEMQLKELEQCVSSIQRHMEKQDALLEELTSSISVIAARLNRTDLTVATLDQDVKSVELRSEPIGERV